MTVNVLEPNLVIKLMMLVKIVTISVKNVLD